MSWTVLLACFGVTMTGVLGCIVGAVISMSANCLTSQARRSVAISALGAMPSLLFAVHALLTGMSEPPYELWTFLPAVLWIFVAPFVFLRSFVVARPLAVPRFVDVLRATHLAGWAAASVLVVYAGILV